MRDGKYDLLCNEADRDSLLGTWPLAVEIYTGKVQ